MHGNVCPRSRVIPCEVFKTNFVAKFPSVVTNIGWMIEDAARPATGCTPRSRRATGRDSRGNRRFNTLAMFRVAARTHRACESTAVRAPSCPQWKPGASPMNVGSQHRPHRRRPGSAFPRAGTEDTVRGKESAAASASVRVTRRPRSRRLLPRGLLGTVRRGRPDASGATVSFAPRIGSAEASPRAKTRMSWFPRRAVPAWPCVRRARPRRASRREARRPVRRPIAGGVTRSVYPDDHDRGHPHRGRGVAEIHLHQLGEAVGPDLGSRPLGQTHDVINEMWLRLRCRASGSSARTPLRRRRAGRRGAGDRPAGQRSRTSPSGVAGARRRTRSPRNRSDDDTPR